VACEVNKAFGTVTYVRPAASKIDAANIPFYANHLPQNLLFLHSFFGAACGFTAFLPHPNDAMGGETSVIAIKGYVSHFYLR